MSPSVEDPTQLAPVNEVKLHGRILRSSGWVAMSLGGKQLASFLSLLVLARLLEPEAFGVVSLAWTILAFVEQIQESGVGSALVYRRTDVRQAAAVAVIWAPLASLSLYAATFLLAPLFAAVFHAAELTSVLRVLGLVLVFRGFAVVPAALLERELDFRARAKGDVSAALVQVAVSVSLAFLGAGVWSLVAGALAGAATQAAVLWACLPWRPRPAANFPLMREMFRYGRFVSIGNFLGVLDNTVDNLAVARLLGTSALGYYSVAFRMADFPTSVVGYTVSRVMFPIYSMLQADVAALRRAYIQNIQRVTLFVLPISVGIIVAAEPIVLALLGEKWLVIVTPLRILGVYSLIKPLAAPSGEVFKGVGKPYLNVLFSIPHVALAIPVLYVLTNAYGLDGAALGILILMAVVGLAATAYAMRLLGVSVAEMASALSLPALCAGVLGIALALLLRPTAALSPVLALVILVAAGLVAFVGAAALFGKPIFVPMWVSLRETRH